MERERRRRREEEEEEEEEERMKKEKNRNGGGKEKMGKETLRWRIGITGVIYGAAQHQRWHTGGHAHCGENRNTRGLPYHTVCPEPNTVLSLDPNTRVFFFLAASWNLITRILLPFSICAMRVITLS